MARKRTLETLVESGDAPETDAEMEAVVADAERRQGRTRRGSPEPRPCGCGCGLVGAGEFRQGHDARYKGNLLRAARAGDAEARAELLRRGWATDDGIDNPKARASAEEVAARKRDRLTVRLNKARELVAELERELAETPAPAA